MEERHARYRVLRRPIVDGGAQVEHRSIEDDSADHRCESRVFQEGRDDGSAHRRPEEHDVGGAVCCGIADGLLQVGPLGRPLLVLPARVGRGARVVAIRDDQRGEAGAERGPEGAQRLASRLIVAVHHDDPGRRAARDVPGRAGAAQAWVDHVLERDVVRACRIGPHVALQRGTGSRSGRVPDTRRRTRWTDVPAATCGEPSRTPFPPRQARPHTSLERSGSSTTSPFVR